MDAIGDGAWHLGLSDGHDQFAEHRAVPSAEGKEGATPVAVIRWGTSSVPTNGGGNAGRYCGESRGGSDGAPTVIVIGEGAFTVAVELVRAAPACSEHAYS